MNSFSNKNQKLAIIGCGYWGTIIAKTLINLKFKKVYIFDNNLRNSKTLKNKFKSLILLKKYRNILDDKEIRNIFIVVPPTKSFPLIHKALLNKKNVFVEKPGVVKINELIRLENLSKKNKLKLMFGYIYCYNDYIEKIHNILNKNLLGKILYVSFQRQNLGPIRNEVDVDYDLSSHDLSIILKLFRKIPKIISFKKYDILKKGIADISNLHLKEKNTFFDISNSWLNPNKVRKITIIGSKKMLLFDEMNQDDQLKIYNQYAKYPKIQDFKKKFFESKALIYSGKNSPVKVKSNPALNNEIVHFLKSKKNITDANFAKKILIALKKLN